jgi:hypothetical protein
VVRIVGSRALGFFPHHTVGSSTRIGVCRAVIRAPTVRLAEIVGVGFLALAAAAAASITMRLRGRAAASARPPPAVRAGRAAASARPPPAVRAQHGKSSQKIRGNPMAGRRAWSIGSWHDDSCRSSQIMLTEYPPAPASNTVPLPFLWHPLIGRGCVQGPEASAGERRRRCRDSLAHQRGGTALAKYKHYRPRRAAADSDAHLGQAPSSSTGRRVGGGPPAACRVLTRC